MEGEDEHTFPLHVGDHIDVDLTNQVENGDISQPVNNGHENVQQRTDSPDNRPSIFHVGSTVSFSVLSHVVYPGGGFLVVQEEILGPDPETRLSGFDPRSHTAENGGGGTGTQIRQQDPRAIFERRRRFPTRTRIRIMSYVDYPSILPPYLPPLQEQGDRLQSGTFVEVDENGDNLPNEPVEEVIEGLSEEVILGTVRAFPYQALDTGSEAEKERCCICLDQYSDGDEVGRLDCGHYNHYNCIKNWLKMRNACPICRARALNV